MRVAMRTAALCLAVGLGFIGCGRRGPPLPPLQVDPEAPQLLPLRQENGQLQIRWYAPRLASDGSVEELRLRRAVVSYRVLDLLELAAEQRAAERAAESEPEIEPDVESDVEPEGGASGGDEGLVSASDAPASGETAPDDSSDPETVTDTGAESHEATDAAATITEPVTGTTAAPPVPPPAEPDIAGAEPVAESATEPAEATEAPTATPPTARPEERPLLPGQEEPSAPAAPSPPGADPEPEALRSEADSPSQDPQTVEPPLETEAPSPDPGPEPEPDGILLDYEEQEFALLSELDSELRGEERSLHLPIEADWVGRRVEVRVRYEARGGISEESEIQSLDVTEPLPEVGEVHVEVTAEAIVLAWRDLRSELGTTTDFADPFFDVFRRRAGESGRVGRVARPGFADAEPVWGEEVCYAARLVLAGAEEERVVADPGPDPPMTGPTPENPAVPSPEEGEEGMASPLTTPPLAPPGAVPGGEDVAAVSGVPAADADDVLWAPVPVRIAGAGASALSIGPTSAETCVTPVDVFPPLPPSDLRLLWQDDRTDLSWRESASADVAGYHVYRSGPDGAPFERLTSTPVEATVFGDASRDPRAEYHYAVTALDGADPPNESPRSESRTVVPR